MIEDRRTVHLVPLVMLILLTALSFSACSSSSSSSLGIYIITLLVPGAELPNFGVETFSIAVASAGHAIRYYQVSPTCCIVLDMDPTHAGIGIMEKKGVLP